MRIHATPTAKTTQRAMAEMHRTAMKDVLLELTTVVGAGVSWDSCRIGEYEPLKLIPCQEGGRGLYILRSRL